MYVYVQSSIHTCKHSHTVIHTLYTLSDIHTYMSTHSTHWKFWMRYIAKKEATPVAMKVEKGRITANGHTHTDA